jgi:hypothetical protein
MMFSEDEIRVFLEKGLGSFHPQNLEKLEVINKIPKTVLKAIDSSVKTKETTCTLIT